MNSAEMIAEIDWLYSLGQGQHYILQAIGYQGRESALEQRLVRAGRWDLVRRLVRLELADA